MFKITFYENDKDKKELYSYTAIGSLTQLREGARVKLLQREELKDKELIIQIDRIEEDKKMKPSEIATIKIEYLKTELIPSWGSQDVVVHYSLTHKIRGFTNTYNVLAEVRDIAICEIYLSAVSVKCTCDTNEETLTNDAVIDLFDDKVN